MRHLDNLIYESHNLGPEDIYESYFYWLTEKVVLPQIVDGSAFELLNTLANTKFEYFIPNDDNRNCEGLELRKEYTQLLDLDDWVLEDFGYLGEGTASMLEVLIALAVRMSAIIDNPEWSTDELFWNMLENLQIVYWDGQLDRYFCLVDRPVIENNIMRVLKRAYSRNGEGGLFPLKTTRKDQRKVELWYQMHAYIQENYDL